jgi:nitroreductase
MDKFIQIVTESKRVKTKYKINKLMEFRWSPRSMSPEPVDKETILTLLESARWSASAFNEQPWRFVVGFHGDETFEKLLSTMVEFNQKWAKNASALVLNIYKKTFIHNETPNATALYDLGQAVSAYALEAVNQGLVAHQMSGYDAKKADELFGLPDDFASVTITAIGHLNMPDALPEELFKIELQNRLRKNLETLVFTDKFNGQSL